MAFTYKPYHNTCPRRVTIPRRVTAKGERETGRGEGVGRWTPRGWDDRTVAGGSPGFSSLRPALPLGDRFTATLGTDSPVAAATVAAATAARRLLLSEWTRRHPGYARGRETTPGDATCSFVSRAVSRVVMACSRRRWIPSSRLLLYEQPRLYRARRARNFADATGSDYSRLDAAIRLSIKRFTVPSIFSISFYQVQTVAIIQW